MVRSISVSTLLGAVLMLGAASAQAKCFDVAHGVVPPLIVLVGHVNGVPDPYGQFVVIPSDFAGNRCLGSTVIVDFQGCDDLRVCSDSLSCASGYKAVRTQTDGNGVATFTVMGSSIGACGTAGSAAHCARVYVDGLLYGSPSVAVVDLDGSQGADANDLSLWLCDAGAGVYLARGDYDGDGTLGANDLSIWIDIMGAGRSYQSVGTGGVPAPCP